MTSSTRGATGITLVNATISRLVAQMDYLDADERAEVAAEARAALANPIGLTDSIQSAVELVQRAMKEAGCDFDQTEIEGVARDINWGC